MTARKRVSEINKFKNDIKQGMEFSFPRLSDSITTKVQRCTLLDVAKQNKKRMYKKGYEYRIAESKAENDYNFWNND